MVVEYFNERKGTGDLYYIKEDHLIVSNNLEIKNHIDYECDYVCSQNGYAGLMNFDYKSRNSGLSDHGKLVETITEKD